MPCWRSCPTRPKHITVLSLTCALLPWRRHLHFVLSTCGRLQDQLVIFMALAGGTSSMLCGELTLHTRTAISIAEQLLPLTADGGGAGARRLTVVAVPTGSTTDGGGQQSSLYTVTCAGAGCR